MRILRFEEFSNRINENANFYPSGHQKAAFSIARNIFAYLENYPELNLELIFQTNIDAEDIESPRFDVAVCSRGNETDIRLIIDVCATSMKMNAYEHVSSMKNSYNIDEAFIYDYQEDEWFYFDRTQMSYSDVLDADLEDFVA